MVAVCWPGGGPFVGPLGLQTAASMPNCQASVNTCIKAIQVNLNKSNNAQIELVQLLRKEKYFIGIFSLVGAPPWRKNRLGAGEAHQHLVGGIVRATRPDPFGNGMPLPTYHWGPCVGPQ